MRSKLFDTNGLSGARASAVVDIELSRPIENVVRAFVSSNKPTPIDLALLELEAMTTLSVTFAELRIRQGIETRKLERAIKKEINGSTGPVLP